MMIILKNSKSIRGIALFTVLTFSLLCMVPKVNAAFIPSNSQKADISSKDLAQIQKFLENKKVQKRLQALGYTSEEIKSRLSKLSDAEIHQLANQMNALAIGGDGVGFVIGLLIVVLLVLLILKIYDKEVVVR